MNQRDPLHTSSKRHGPCPNPIIKKASVTAAVLEIIIHPLLLLDQMLEFFRLVGWFVRKKKIWKKPPCSNLMMIYHVPGSVQSTLHTLSKSVPTGPSETSIIPIL